MINQKLTVFVNFEIEIENEWRKKTPPSEILSKYKIFC